MKTLTVLRAAATYFLTVFGAGFAMALVRIPVLVPAFGARTAELLETPFMLAVIVWASRRLVQRHTDLRAAQRLAAGLLALACLIGAEVALAYLMGARSLSGYVQSRDPVSGSVYLASLVFFALAPAWVKLRPLATPLARSGGQTAH